MDTSKLFAVEGKVVLVTGGAKGIGAMISEGFIAASSKNRVYVSSRSGEHCEAFAREMNDRYKGRGGECRALPADLSKYDECVRVAEDLSSREKRLDVLVNNAGANWGAPLQEYPDKGFGKVLTLNLHRVFTLTQQLVPLLVAGQPEQGPFTDPSRIINIGSIDGLRVPKLETYAYSASKAGLTMLSNALASKLGERGVTCNTIAPGALETKMMAATLEAGREAILEAIPLARIGTPEDVAGTCLYLASRAGAWTNGAVIALDGGTVVAGKL